MRDWGGGDQKQKVLQIKRSKSQQQKKNGKVSDKLHKMRKRTHFFNWPN